MILKPGQENILKRMYSRILTHKGADKLINNSVFLTLINMQDSKRLRMLTYNHLYISEILDKECIESLIKNKFVKEIGSINGKGIIFSAKGVYRYEKSKEILKDEILIKYYENKFFTFKEENTLLNDKEMIIVASMLLSRSFNLNSSISLNKSGPYKDKWIEVLNRTARLLCNLKIVEEKIVNNLFPNTASRTGKQGIVQLMQKTDSIPKRKGIYGLYTAPGDRKYYLDMLNKDSSIDINKYNSLLNTIFPLDKISDTFEACKLISQFQEDLINDYKVYIVDNLEKDHALDYQHNDLIIESFEKYFIYS